MTRLMSVICTILLQAVSVSQTVLTALVSGDITTDGSRIFTNKVVGALFGTSCEKQRDWRGQKEVEVSQTDTKNA